MKSWTTLATIIALAGIAASQKKPCVPHKHVESGKLQRAIKLENLKTHAEAFSDMANDSENFRLAGSTGYNATASYIVEHLEALGDYYTVEKQTYSDYVEYFNEGAMVIDGEEVVSAPLQFSRNATLEGLKLIWVDSFGCNGTDDFPTEVEGNIALVSRGPQNGMCPFAVKSANAGAAGAVGLIIFDHVLGAPPFNGVLAAEDPPQGQMVPTSSVSNLMGLGLAARLRANDTITVDRFYTATNGEVLYSQNIIATTTRGDPDNILFVGAHLDSVGEGPGMNDNGSGSIAILEVALQLGKYITNSTVRFAWWTAEEAGLLGSTHYVETAEPEELLKVRMYLNFDMVASGNGILGVYDGDGSDFGLGGPPGSGEAEVLYEEYFASQNLSLLPVEFNGRSDYGPFLEVNIPCGGLFTGADDVKTDAEVELFGGTAGETHDVNYHTQYDTIGNWSYPFLEINTKAIAHSVAVYGMGFDGVPAREPPAKELTFRDRRDEVRSLGACSQQAMEAGRFRACNVA
ncbi:aminopeptidase Y [Plectosphaerella plurivora]|uniref:Peptide hydrolase n=1 Tax=Plectosphaerella plurivora TaxID=936078 RepID=A0A9P8VMP4_9PEZI|nr:aminopeptidase Y [Plectosphaerella plurivora]